MATLAERILISFSIPPERLQGSGKHAEPATLDNALDLLVEQVPGFFERIAGRRVLDFGCGHGLQSLAMASKATAFVLGLDANPSLVHSAERHREQLGIAASAAQFSTAIPAQLQGTFDVVISHNSMEHFPDPKLILGVMAAALRPGGVMIVTFGPPWFAPYGSHMHYFCRVPWLQFWFSEKTIMRVRSRYKSDGAMRFEDVEGGLNKMSLAKFSELARDSALHVEHSSYRCIRGLNFLAALPGVRELFVNHVTYLLKKPG